MSVTFPRRPLTYRPPSFYNAAITKRKRRAHFHGFMIDVHKRMHAYKVSKGTKYDAVPDVARDLFQEAWLLCFDEMQVTDIAGWLRGEAPVAGCLSSNCWFSRYQTR